MMKTFQLTVHSWLLYLYVLSWWEWLHVILKNAKILLESMQFGLIAFTCSGDIRMDFELSDHI